MSALLIVVNDNKYSAAQLARAIDKPRRIGATAALQRYLKRVLSKVGEAHVTTQVASAFATATITCNNAAAVNSTDTTTIMGVALALVAAPASNVQFAKGATDATMATNLAACINANPTLQKVIRAKAAAAVVTMTCKVPGLLGDLLSLAETGNGMTISGALFTGGASDEADSFAYGFDPTL